MLLVIGTSCSRASAEVPETGQRSSLHPVTKVLVASHHSRWRQVHNHGAFGSINVLFFFPQVTRVLSPGGKLFFEPHKNKFLKPQRTFCTIHVMFMCVRSVRA